MASCGVIGCRSAIESSTRSEDSVSFHLFPKDKALKNKWLKAIGRHGWKPFKNACVCSKHFGPNQVAYVKNNFKKLKNDAYPDVDVPLPEYDEENDASESDNGSKSSSVCRICLATNVKMFSLQTGVLQSCLEAIPALYEYYYFKELPQRVCYLCSAILIKSYNLIEKSMVAQTALLETLSENLTITNDILKDQHREKLKLKYSLQSHNATPTTVYEYVYSEIDKASVLVDKNSHSDAGYSPYVGNIVISPEDTIQKCDAQQSLDVIDLNRSCVYVSKNSVHAYENINNSNDYLNDDTIKQDSSSDGKTQDVGATQSKTNDHDYLNEHAIKDNSHQYIDPVKVQPVTPQMEFASMGSIHTQKTNDNKVQEPIIVLENHCIKLKNPGYKLQFVSTQCGGNDIMNNDTETKNETAFEDTKLKEVQTKLIKPLTNLKVTKVVDCNIDNYAATDTKNQKTELLAHKGLNNFITMNPNKIIIKAVKVITGKNKSLQLNKSTNSLNKSILISQDIQSNDSNLKEDISDKKVENRKTELLNNLVAEINDGVNESMQTDALEDSSKQTTIESTNEPTEEGKILKDKNLVVWDNFDIVELTPEQQKEEWEKSMKVPAWDNLKTYQCGECSKLFLRRPAYLNHMVTHDPKRGKVVCPVCKARFANNKHLSMHVKVTHFKKFHCKLCTSVLSSESSARKHLYAHGPGAGAGSALRRCRACAYTSASREELAAHARDAHAPAHVCAHCGNGFHSARGFLLHLRYAHPREFMAQDPLVTDYRCEPCDINFSTVDAKRVHAMTSCPHKQVDEPNLSPSREGDSERQHTCGKCGAQFPTRQVLQAHVRTEHDLSRRVLDKPDRRSSIPVESQPPKHLRIEPNRYPLQCEHCGVMIKTRQEHWRHTSKEHPSKVITYKKIITVLCSICGKGFQNSTMLRLHELRHARPAVQCEQCPRRFYDQRGLQLHALIHSGERPWRCGLCGVAFHSRPNYERHKKVHSTETPYKCPMCESRFKYSSSVNLHIRSVHYKQPYRKKPRPRIAKVKKLNVIVDHNNDSGTTNVSEESVNVEETNMQDLEVVGDFLIQDQANEPENNSNPEAIENEVTIENNETFEVLDGNFEIIGEYAVQEEANQEGQIDNPHEEIIEYQDNHENYGAVEVLGEDPGESLLVYENVVYTESEHILEEQVFDGCENYVYMDDQGMDIDN